MYFLPSFSNTWNTDILCRSNISLLYLLAFVYWHKKCTFSVAIVAVNCAAYVSLKLTCLNLQDLRCTWNGETKYIFTLHVGFYIVHIFYFILVYLFVSYLFIYFFIIFFYYFFFFTFAKFQTRGLYLFSTTDPIYARLAKTVHACNEWT